jgi:hypothetical protein
MALWRILPLRQRAGVGLSGKLIAKAGLVPGMIQLLSHGEAPLHLDVRQYRTRARPLTTALQCGLGIASLLS